MKGVFAPEKPNVSDDVFGRIILTVARTSIEKALEERDLSERLGEPWLEARAACFVTLSVNGELRGCVGSLEATRRLGEDVRANAVAAALHDPRFPPLSMEELPRIAIEVSVLSELAELTDKTEIERALRPGEDGVVLEFGDRRATFLPQVWEKLPDPHQFLRALRRKAGLPPDFESPALRYYRYTVQRFREP